MNDTAHLAALRVFTQRIRIIATTDLTDFTAGITDHFVGPDHIAITQTDFITEYQTFVFLVRFFEEILAINPHFTGHRNRSGAHGFVLRMHRPVKDLDLVRFPVFDHYLDRTQHAKGTRRILVQIITNGGFEHGHIDGGIGPGNADHIAKLAQAGGGIATTAQTGDGRHARIIPTRDMTFVDQLLELALAGHGVVQVQTGKLGLLRLRRQGAMLDDPVIQRTMGFKLQRAQTVGHPFQRIGDRMGKVIHRIDAPLVPGLVMADLAHPVQHRIAHIDIRAGHIDLGAQHCGALVDLPGAHFAKQRQILGHRTVTERAGLTWLFQGAAVLAHLLGAQLIHIGQALVDQLHRTIMDLLEIA